MPTTRDMEESEERDREYDARLQEMNAAKDGEKKLANPIVIFMIIIIGSVLCVWGLLYFIAKFF